jgi:hypothetical protein
MKRSRKKLSPYNPSNYFEMSEEVLDSFESVEMKWVVNVDTASHGGHARLRLHNQQRCAGGHAHGLAVDEQHLLGV